MSLRDVIFGKPLASSEESKEALSVLTGVPVMGLDALSSVGYGPEAALVILTTAGVLGLQYFPFIALAVVVELTSLYFSYQQTAAAYPSGGGAYNVAKDNLGIQAGLWAAVALLIDYLLNVAVGIAAGVGVVVSAIPRLHPYTLPLCLAVLLTLVVINLRGVREAGLTFVVPVLLFAGCILAAMAVGFIDVLRTGGHPHAVVPPPPLPHTTAAVGAWLLLGAFANGCTAMTGIEAVSNGVPLFQEPKVRNARRTLTVVYVTLAVFLLGMGYLCPHYRIAAMDETQPGYQTVLSQLMAAIAGHGAFYYVASASIFLVLTYSAQTSFADFPRVCRLLAEDDFLPHPFANRGRRLVFSYGIVILGILSAVILIVFRGVTDSLIALFAVGAFTAFVFSQAGMVVHWRRRPGPGVRVKLLCNAFGAITTSVALAVIIIAKFTEGAWITVVVVPGLVILLGRIRRHYRKVEKEIEVPLALRPGKSQPPIVIVPIRFCDRVAEKAMSFALMLSDDIRALHVTIEGDDKERLKEVWESHVVRPIKAAGMAVPKLEIVDSPYRWINQPIIDFVSRTRDANPSRLIALVIPELVEPHWYEYLLHNLQGARLRAQLLLRRDERTVIISTPWYPKEKP